MRKNLHFLLVFLLCLSASWVQATETPEGTVVFDMDYHGSKYWRIPALVKTPDGSLVAIADKRGDSLGDLPNVISIMARKSTDNGKTWSEPIMIAEGGNGKTYGDAAVVVDNLSGFLICMFVGDNGLWTATPSNRQGVYVAMSRDNGDSWSEPYEITDQVYAGHESWYAGFAGSGNGLCTKDGRLMFVLAIRPTWTQGPPLHNYAIYSDDNGETWQLSKNAACTDGDEAKVVELEDGTILMSIRNRNKGKRLFCKSNDGGETWGTPYFQDDIIEPNCNGDIIRYDYTSAEVNPEGKSYLLHSLPNHPDNRQDVTLFLSADEGETWPIKRRLVNGYSAYSSMTVLDDGTIGVLVEEGKWDANLPGDDGFRLVFYRLPLSWLTEQGADQPVATGTLQLNGIDRYMRIADHDDFDVAIGESYTVTCKVKMPFYNRTGRFVAKRSYTDTDNSGTTGWELWGDKDENTRFSTNLSPFGSPWGGKGNGTGATFAEEEWAHLTWVFDWANNKTIIYVNGKQQEAKDLHADFQTMSMENPFDVLVGCGYSNNNNHESVPAYFLEGEMDDVRFYNRALTPIEVMVDMSATVDNTTEGLVAAYDFEAISGSNVPDISGNGHNGTLVNFPDYSTVYAVTIETPEATQGTLKVMNGLDEVKSGDKVAENTQLRVTATAAEGYKLVQVLVNGNKLEGNTFSVTGPTTVAAEFAEIVPEYCTYAGNSKHDGRYLKTMSLTGGINEFSFSVHNQKKQAIYVDKTDQVIEAYAGDELQPVTEWIGEWMHGYLYIDYDQDYNFNFTYNDDGYPRTDEELVSFTYFNPGEGSSGKNSKGQTVANNSRLDNIPSFTLPADLAPGDYRVRIKVDWNHLDPCGHPGETANLLTDNGGNIVDFTLRIVEKVAPGERTFIVTLPQYADVKHGFLSVIGPDKFLTQGDNEVKENTVLNISAEPEEGYIVEYLKANDTDIKGQKTYTVTCNTVFSVSFIEKPDYVLAVNVEGEGDVAVTNATGATIENGAVLLEGDELTITATAAEGYELSSLTVNGEDFVNGNTYTVDGSVTVNATFVEIPKYVLSVSVDGLGSVDVKNATGMTFFDGTELMVGDVLTITAMPLDGYEVGSLTVNGEDFVSGSTHTVNGSVNVAATFVESPKYALTVNVEGEGKVTVTDAFGRTYGNGDSVVKGTEVTIAAKAAEAYVLKSLAVNGEAFTSGEKLTVSEALTIDALFEEDPLVSIHGTEADQLGARYQNGILYVKGVKAGQFTVSIYNLTGKMVKEATEATINVSDFAKGCYIVKIATDEAEKAVKFIKK